MRRPLLALLLAASARAGVVEVPPLSPPLSPAPVIAQLAFDMKVLSPSGGIPSLAPSVLAPSPAAWANMSALVKGAEPARPLVAEKSAALERVAFAQKVLGKFEPEKFAKLGDAQRDAALEELWDGWKARGLVPGGPDALDRAVLAAVEDKELTSASKSVFLGVAVLGYPLEDSLWLQRTRISDAIDENTLQYPSGQTWTDPSGTPEFLGTTKIAQKLVDDWGAATEFGKEVVARRKAGLPGVPSSGLVPRAAALRFAALVDELAAAKDAEALAYLSGQDPTFSAFLLDVRKPGYYLYNGDRGVIGRIMRAKAAADLGVRRLDHPVPGLTISSVYYYRPRRVLERLKEADSEPAEHAAREKELLAGYARRLAPLVP